MIMIIVIRIMTELTSLKLRALMLVTKNGYFIEVIMEFGRRLGGQPLLNRGEAGLKVGRRDVDVLRDPLGACVHDR